MTLKNKLQKLFPSAFICVFLNAEISKIQVGFLLITNKKSSCGIGVLRKVFINPSKFRFLYNHAFYSKLQKDTENVNTKSILASTQARENISAFLQK